MRWGFGAAAVIAALLVAGCSSSSSGPAPVSSASASAPVTTPPPTATPTPTPSPSPSPTPTKPKVKPLSPYEADPAVKALRAWASQAGHTINTGKYDDAKLMALMTPAFAKTMKSVAGTEIGHRYPGPVPFTPIKVVVTSSSQRAVKLCVLSQGFSLNPKTGKPAQKRRVNAVNAGATRQGGRWVVSKSTAATFSCSGVTIKKQKW